MLHSFYFKFVYLSISTAVVMVELLALHDDLLNFKSSHCTEMHAFYYFLLLYCAVSILLSLISLLILFSILISNLLCCLTSWLALLLKLNDVYILCYLQSLWYLQLIVLLSKQYLSISVQLLAIILIVASFDYWVLVDIPYESVLAAIQYALNLLFSNQFIN